jgi:hypothetical protein
MGFTTFDFPPVDATTFRQRPYRERLKLLQLHWVDFGLGTPKFVGIVYAVRLIFFYALGGILVSTLTSGLNPLEPAAWFFQPIMYQKLVLWTVLLECLGFAGAWGPLACHFKPWTGGFRYYARRGSLRVPPWPGKIPFTGGDARTLVDIALYVALLASIVVALAAPGIDKSSLGQVIGDNAGRTAPVVIIPIIALLLMAGVRDKVLFLAARSEQYLPALIFFAFFPFVDMIVAAKLLIVVVWCGASFSKIGRHFAHVIPPMVSSTPWLPFKSIKRLHYRNFPDDLRPSVPASRLAHIAGTFVEMGAPLVLLFSRNHTVTLLAVLLMIAFHAFIISTLPMAVPLEWNLLFMYITPFLFLGYPAYAGYALGDMKPALLAVTVIGLLFFPVLGNVRPDLVSFLPSLRQYAGNWATAVWALAPGAEAKLNRHLVKAAPMVKDQLVDLYGEDIAELLLNQVLAFFAMHSQGRGVHSVVLNQLGDDVEHYTLRDGESSCSAVVGFAFGDGHLHNQTLIRAIQKRCRFTPGEFIVVWAESEPFGNGRQQYWVLDAAIGVVERGSWAVADAVKEQPWLPNGPIPTHIDWRLPEYRRVSHRPDTPIAAEVDSASGSSQSK